MRFFSFSLLIATGALLGHLYIYHRLVRRLVPAGRWRRALGCALAAITVLPLPLQRRCRLPSPSAA